MNKILAAHEGRERKREDSRAQRDLIQRLKLAEEKVRVMSALRGAHTTAIIRPREGKNTSEATAFAIATDWHLEEEITLESTNGYNQMNLRIAEQRAKTFFERVVRLTRKERQDVKIHDLVLFLGGDFITGHINEDQKQMGLLKPMEAIVFAQDLLEAGIKFLLEHGGFRKIIIPCQDGNHGRTTVRQHFASRKGNALEWLMYHNLAKRIPECEWVITKALHSIVTVYDRPTWFHHGDTVSYNGGIGGHMIPLTKKTLMWDWNEPGYMYVQGHLHNWTPGIRRLINGSLAGVNPFAIALSGENQPPIQAFFLQDKTRGTTVQIPILV